MIHSNCKSEMICVQDFCGNGNIQGTFKYQINFWADWCPNCKEIIFGGYWCEIPNFKINKEPDFENLPIKLKNHIKKFEPLCEIKYQNYLNEI